MDYELEQKITKSLIKEYYIWECEQKHIDPKNIDNMINFMMDSDYLHEDILDQFEEDEVERKYYELKEEDDFDRETFSNDWSDSNSDMAQYNSIMSQM